MIDQSYYLLLPDYVQEFLKAQSSASPSVHDALTWDMKTYLDYLKDKLVFPSIGDIPISVFLSITTDDIEAYMDYMSCEKHRKKQTIRRKIWSLSVFFSYLVDEGLLSSSPVSDVELPDLVYQSPKPLTDRQIEVLLNGVEQNTLTGKQGTDGHFHVFPIDHRTKLLREISSPRDHAILSLLLKTGLIAKEAAALNQDDVSDDGKVLKVDGEDVPLTEDVSHSLMRYIHGGGQPDFIWNKYPKDARVILALCDQYKTSDHILDAFRESFGGISDSFARDILKAADCMRRQGRSALNPKVPDALFISRIGYRLSVRQIERLVLKMSHTYLGVGLTPINMAISARKRENLKKGKKKKQ